MEIQNSTIEDVDFIIDLYRSATAYQKERFISHWPEGLPQHYHNAVVSLFELKV